MNYIDTTKYLHHGGVDWKRERKQELKRFKLVIVMFLIIIIDINNIFTYTMVVWTWAEKGKVLKRF
jgi:hypothetical protein